MEGGHMQTKILKEEELDEAVEILRNNGLVALKTDTVYGLAASSHAEKNYFHLAQVKNRPKGKPFPLMLSSIEEAEKYLLLSPKQRLLMRTFLPGPITFIVRRRKNVFPFLADQETLGVRVAKDPWLRTLIERNGSPLWLPSANLSNHPTAINHQMVLDQLDGKIEAVLEGKAPGGVASSVVDISGDEIKILREGPISEKQIKEALSVKKIALACDHGAFDQKERIKKYLLEEGYEVKDFGAFSEDSVDYPDTIYPAAKAVAEGKFHRGIVLCGSGIGASITANKVKGIRCALVTSTEVARLTREHNDSNILALAGRTTDTETNMEIVKTWLDVDFSEDERHVRRIKKLHDIENKECSQ